MSVLDKQMISIGMPVYNGEKYIKEALDSLLSQTYRDFELIISDNASTDSTQSICESYAIKDKRIRYIRQKNNIGPAANFKYVLDQASSEYFMWAAHDDLWEPSFIEKSLSILSTNPNTGFVFPSFYLTTTNSQKQFPSNISLFNFISNKDWKTRVLSFANLHHHSHKCNLVYSIFRIDVLRSAYQTQDISNDGILSMVILSKAMGQPLSEHLFHKRYTYQIPGHEKQNWKTQIKLFISKNFKIKSTNFLKALESSLNKQISLFPCLKNKLTEITEHYHETTPNSDYKIIKNLKF